MEKKKKSAGQIILTVMLSIAIFVLAVFAVFNILFFKSPVVGVSMQPTFNAELEVGMSTKFYEESKIKDKAYVYRFSKGELGDIVLAERESIVNGKKTTKLVIKRIVATSGQTVDIKKAEDEIYYLYVNGEKVVEKYIKDYSDMEVCYNAFVAYKESIGIPADSAIKLNKDEVFIMGDNRAHSDDSSDYGPIKKNTIKGKVAFTVRYNENLLTYLWHKIFG